MKIKEINFAGIFLFLRKKFGINDKLTLWRFSILFLYGWVLCPVILEIFNLMVAGILMFILTAIIMYVFLEISKKKNEEESFFLWLASLISGKNKHITLVTLFVFEPFLFVVYYRDSYQYGSVTKKTVILLIMICSLLASSFWLLLLIKFGLNTIIWDWLKSLFLTIKSNF